MKRYFAAVMLLLAAGCQAAPEQAVPEDTGGGNIMGERSTMDTLKTVGEQKEGEAETVAE